ncbi:MAG: sigma-70 family RNA polymerase sigma factor [Rhodoferax sp.]
MERPELVQQIPGLRRYARALTGDAWAADDLVQDTLERACSRWRLWLVGSDLRAWLFTLMHNLFVSDLRRLNRQRRAGSTLDLDDVAHELAAPDAAQDLALDLQRCLLQLPEEQRTVLLLVTLEDMAYTDVARITGTPIGTVMSRLSRARARLQALLDAPAEKPAPSGSTVTPLHRPSRPTP